MPDSEVTACFTAMMLHDICKTVLDEEGRWRNHEKLDPTIGAAYSEDNPINAGDINKSKSDSYRHQRLHAAGGHVGAGVVARQLGCG